MLFVRKWWNIDAKDLHPRCFRESRKRHCSLFLLILYQINVILTISGSWLLQNLAKRRKSNKFNRLQIEVFFLRIISPSLPPQKKHTRARAHAPNIGPSNLSFVLLSCIRPRNFTVSQVRTLELFSNREFRNMRNRTIEQKISKI